MAHAIHQVVGFGKVSAFTLRVRFGDGTEQVIDFRPVMHGELYGPLSNERFFDQVKLDTEANTLVWPNGADFDPTTLHDWPVLGTALATLARQWSTVPG